MLIISKLAQWCTAENKNSVKSSKDSSQFFPFSTTMLVMAGQSLVLNSISLSLLKIQSLFQESEFFKINHILVTNRQTKKWRMKVALFPLKLQFALLSITILYTSLKKLDKILSSTSIIAKLSTKLMSLKDLKPAIYLSSNFATLKLCI